MTVGGILIGIFLSLLPLIVIGCIAYYLHESNGHVVAGVLGIVISVIVLCAIWIGLAWYYSNTASGQRALKTQKSEFGDGLQRELTVYDMQGEVVAHYEGRFDIDFSSSQSGQRIVFDDEQGIRHVIYPGGGIVIVNEVPAKK